MRVITSSKYSKPVYDEDKKLWKFSRLGFRNLEFAEEIKFIDRTRGIRYDCSSSGVERESKIAVAHQ